MFYSEKFGFKVPEQDDIYNIDHVEFNVSILERLFKRLSPHVTDMEMTKYIKTEYVNDIVVGQTVIANKEVYTYVGDDCHLIGSYCKCGGGNYFNIAIPFYDVFSCLDGSAAEYSPVEFTSEYDNQYNIASGYYNVFKKIGGSLSDYSTLTDAEYLMNESDIEPAFDYVFGKNIIAIQFHKVYTRVASSSVDYNAVEFVSDYDNANNVANGYYDAFSKVDGAASDYQTSTVDSIMEESDIEPAYNYVFGKSGTDDNGDNNNDTESDAMSSEDINAAISKTWNGESSEDEDAMTAVDVETATETQWDGSTSEDEDAITADEIDSILT